VDTWVRAHRDAAALRHLLASAPGQGPTSILGEIASHLLAGRTLGDLPILRKAPANPGVQEIEVAATPVSGTGTSWSAEAAERPSETATSICTASAGTHVDAYAHATLRQMDLRGPVVALRKPLDSNSLRPGVPDSLAATEQ
jgi:hypothetical protein